MISPVTRYISQQVIPAALSILPPQMDYLNARAMMLAIGLQETKFQHRLQMKGGPARGFWQFERMGGVLAVLDHKDTSSIAIKICLRIGYEPTIDAVFYAIEDNDILAAVFARLLLWSDPRTMPSVNEVDKAWSIYLTQWNPGKPHKETWHKCLVESWAVLNEEMLNGTQQVRRTPEIPSGV